MSRGGSEREGDTESKTRSRLQAVSTEPDGGSNSQTVRSRPEPKSQAQPTEPLRGPKSVAFVYTNYKVAEREIKEAIQFISTKTNKTSRKEPN